MNCYPHPELTEKQQIIFEEMMQKANEYLPYIDQLFSIAVFIDENFTRNDNCKTLKITNVN
jgi:hypothetical protein